MGGIELMTMVSSDFFESLSRMELQPNYKRILDSHVPADWHRKQFDVWLLAQPNVDSLAQQGFKIHVSATRRNAETLLKIVIPECVAHEIPFKVVADPRLLSLMNSKNYYRGGSGKFIVLYPPTIEIFKEILARLYELTDGQEGPYILSDRRYKDSKVLYYRFGGFFPMYRVDPNGTKTLCIQTPDGELEPDERLPYYKLPTWISDPFPVMDSLEAPAENILNGRYQVDGAIAFSNRGGVYDGTDTLTGRKVILKEARPFSNYWIPSPDSSDYLDGVRILEREFRALKKLQGLPSIVQCVDFFKEWEHSFLVEERVEGIPLRRYRALDDFVVIASDGGQERVQRFCEKFCVLARQLIEIVLAAHSRRVLLVDISPNNFLVNVETLEVTLIDLETAIDLDAPQTGDDVVRLWTTPGSRRPGRYEMGEYLPEDDFYALGMVLYSLLVPIQTFFEMHPGAVESFIDDIALGVGLPGQVKETIFLLLQGKAAEARDVLHKWEPRLSPAASDVRRQPAQYWEQWEEADRERIGDEIRRVIPGITSFLLATFDVRREDRLWPGDVMVFDTNPLSVACGACGPLLFLKDAGHPAPQEVRDWLLRQEFRADAYPSGLYWGLAGIACTLAELGFESKALNALRRANESPLRFAKADMWHGAAGLGWANLWFYSRDPQPDFLQRALEAGEHLLASAQDRETGCCWPNLDGNVHYGFAYGASGICLFLSQLYRATGDTRFGDLARRGLAFELASALDTAGVIRWFNHEKAREICEPYWEYGSAGIGCVFIRCATLLGDEHYRRVAEDVEAFAFCKWTVIPSQFSGLAGIGEYMLDLFKLTGRELYLNKAYAVADTILKYGVEKPQGIAFPGRFLLRLSNDFGTGSSGIGLFLLRLLRLGPRRFVDLELTAS
jgi:serine/threonine protein kinase